MPLATCNLPANAPIQMATQLNTNKIGIEAPLSHSYITLPTRCNYVTSERGAPTPPPPPPPPPVHNISFTFIYLIWSKDAGAKRRTTLARLLRQCCPFMGKTEKLLISEQKQQQSCWLCPLRQLTQTPAENEIGHLLAQSIAKLLQLQFSAQLADHHRIINYRKKSLGKQNNSHCQFWWWVNDFLCALNAHFFSTCTALVFCLTVWK